MEEFSKNGRKLRPRKAVGAQTAHSSSEGPAYSTSRDFKRDRQYPTRSDSRRTYSSSERHSERSDNTGYRRSYNEGQGGYHRSSRAPQQDERSSYRKPSAGRPQYGNSEDRPAGEHRTASRRGSFQGKPRRGAKPVHSNSLSKAAQEGISRMISRRPQVSDGSQRADFDRVQIPIQEEVRLNKFIANSGVCSRREADTLIQAGVVTVNGEVVTELGTKVNICKDDVRFNGERLKGEEKVYLVMNKPRGYVTTASDPHAEKTVMELLKGCPFRVFPVGRLDKNTTGVLMFTNDGEIAERLTHPSYDKKKIYQVSLDKPLSEEDREKVLTGVTLSDGVEKADEVEFIDSEDHRKLGVEIHSGKNRVVRRLFDALGYDVKALDRVYFAGLTKKGLKKGQWRQLSEGEVNILKMGAYV